MGLLALGAGGLPRAVAATLAAYGALAAGMVAWRPRWAGHLLAPHVLATALLAFSATIAIRPLVALAALAVAIAVVAFVRTRDRALRETAAQRDLLGPRLERAQRERGELARQLDRRINEIFSLQELGYVLSESLEQERIIEQVARYAARFLQADGALVALADERRGQLHVAAAEGSLRELLGREIPPDESTLLLQAMGRERIELAHAGEASPARLMADVEVRSAAVAPLKAHGLTLGALAVVDRRDGPFTTEDLWLLSTVATQAAVVLTNSRFVEMFRQGKEEWETTFDALSEGIAVVGDDGRIRRANRALAILLGVSEPTLINEPFSQLLFQAPASVEDLLEASRRGESRPALTVRSEKLGRTLRLAAARFPPEREGAVSVVVLVEDVTEQQAIEAQLIQNEKMAVVGQLVSGVAHELNNPLTSIAGLAELLLEQGGLLEPSREHLRVMHDQAERAGRIVRNLLTFARKGVPEKSSVDLKDVVARTALLISYELKLRSIELERRILPEPAVVLGDRYELQQVLLNLLTNAVQALSHLPDDARRRILIEVTRADGHIVMRVVDSGPGVPAELAGQLFTPFFTTKDPGQGTGLGLSISYGIVESHGGRLTYATAPDGGAAFTVQLPAIETHEPERDVEDRPGATGPVRRILVVDEDPSVHRILLALFGPDGHLLDVVRTGEQGLDLALSRDYDLVVADARATVRRRRFVQALVAERADLRGRIVVSSREGARNSDDLHALEQFRVIPKPFNLRDLHAAAAEIFLLPPAQPREPGLAGQDRRSSVSTPPPPRGARGSGSPAP